MERRIRPLKSIRTNEEYEEYKKYLESYLIEYKWYQGHGKGEAKELVMKKSKGYEENSDSRIALENRARLIENDEYVPALKRNITAYLITIAEYDAKIKNISPLEILKGLLSKDEKTKEYLNEKNLKNELEKSGFYNVEPVSLSIQTQEDAIRQVFEECDFINITKPEYALVPISEKSNEMQSKVSNMLEQFLEEYGANNENKSTKETKINSHKHAISKENAKRKDNHINKDEMEI